MRIKNTENHYGIVAILFHWSMAILIIGLLTLGLWMVNLPIGHTKLKLYGWHKEYGFSVLILVFFRLMWRATNLTPALSIPWWEKTAARMVHGIFYIFMFAMPLSGWLMTSAAGLPASFFGLFVLPDPISPNENARLVFREVHELVGYGLIFTILLHIIAALKHHFINKDDILRRILS